MACARFIWFRVCSSKGILWTTYWNKCDTER